MRQLKIAARITSRESLSLDKYLNEISKIPVLSPNEESELARRAREGDEVALEKLTRSNLRFVVSVAKQYQNQGLSLSDLINEGNVGLMKATKRYDETKGFKFISYAVWWIRQSILHAIIEYSRMVRLPTNKVNSYNKVNNVYVKYIQEFEREPTNDELAEILNLHSGEIAEMLKGASYVSLDSPIGNDDDSSTMIELTEDKTSNTPDDDLLRQSLSQELNERMNVLAPREKEVLNAYYGINGSEVYSLDEIGELFALTRERVRQIKERAIRRLRNGKSADTLRAYLG